MIEKNWKKASFTLLFSIYNNFRMTCMVSESDSFYEPSWGLNGFSRLFGCVRSLASHWEVMSSFSHYTISWCLSRESWENFSSSRFLFALEFRIWERKRGMFFARKAEWLSSDHRSEWPLINKVQTHFYCEEKSYVFELKDEMGGLSEADQRRFTELRRVEEVWKK